MPPFFIEGLFFVVALIYASVGFGGGSSYIALLLLFNLPYSSVPIIALICNIVVVAGSSIHYIRSGYLNKKLLFPLVLASIPMAYLGGKIPLSKETFTIILCITLFVTGARLLIKHKQFDEDTESYTPIPVPLNMLIGAVIGFLSGVTGIGGGIFLSPILYNLRAGSPKQIATISSLFILLNSMGGLLGQLQKHGTLDVMSDFWTLPVVALLGGQIGNLMLIKFIPARITALLTALLVLGVAGQLAFRLYTGS